MNDRQSLGALGIAAGVLLIAITFFVTAIGGSKFDTGLDTESLKTGIPLALILIGVAIVAAGIGWLTDPSKHRPAWLQWIVPSFFTLIAAVGLMKPYLPDSPESLAKEQARLEEERSARKKKNLIFRLDAKTDEAWEAIFELKEGRWTISPILDSINKAHELQQKLIDNHSHEITNRNFTLLQYAKEELVALKKDIDGVKDAKYARSSLDDDKEDVKRMKFQIRSRFETAHDGYGVYEAVSGYSNVILIAPEEKLPKSELSRAFGVISNVVELGEEAYIMTSGRTVYMFTYKYTDRRIPTKEDYAAKEAAIKAAEAELEYQWNQFSRVREQWPKPSASGRNR